MAQPGKRSDALGMAVRMEEEGIAFYTQAADRVKNKMGKQMFLSLVGDEKRHKQIFTEMAAKEGVRPAAADELEKSGPRQRMGHIFREAAAQLAGQIGSETDDVKVIDLAKTMEEKAYGFYVETARLVTDEKEKRILLKIAAEENEHFRILDDTRLYLTYPEMWHIMQEKPLIDGG